MIDLEDLEQLCETTKYGTGRKTTRGPRRTRVAAGWFKSTLRKRLHSAQVNANAFVKKGKHRS